MPQSLPQWENNPHCGGKHVLVVWDTRGKQHEENRKNSSLYTRGKLHEENMNNSSSYTRGKLHEENMNNSSSYKAFCVGQFRSLHLGANETTICTVADNLSSWCRTTICIVADNLSSWCGTREGISHTGKHEKFISRMLCHDVLP